jgi:Transposase
VFIDGLARKDLESQQKGVPRHRKLDKAALRAHVRIIRMRCYVNAQHFGIGISSMGWALPQIKLTRKKRR